MTLYVEEEDILQFIEGFLPASGMYPVHVSTCKQIHKHIKLKSLEKKEINRYLVEICWDTQYRVMSLNPVLRHEVLWIMHTLSTVVTRSFAHRA